MARNFVIVVKLHVMLQVGRTEMIKDTLDPNFVKKFIVDYFFEERQLLTFAMWALLTVHMYLLLSFLWLSFKLH